MGNDGENVGLQVRNCDERETFGKDCKQCGKR